MESDQHTADINDAWAVQYRLKRNRLPLDTRTVREHVAADMPGIYAIWVPTFAVDEFRCAYVGMSATDIRNRLVAHLRDAHNDQLHRDLRHFKDLATFSFQYTKNGKEAKLLESAMIQRLAPECNIAENR